MNDFDPLVLFFVVRESFGVWFWPWAAGVALVLLAVLFAAVRVVRRHRFGRTFGRALLAGLVTAVLVTALVPLWTAVGPGALSDAVDLAFAFLFALVPGAFVAAAVFVLCAFRLRVR